MAVKAPAKGTFIDAFKTAQDFAAKTVVRPDGQQDWLAWQTDPNNPNRKRLLEKKEEEARPLPGEEEEVFVPVTHQKTREELKVWAELKDAEGNTYWFNAETGERTRKRPRMQEDVDAAAAAAAKAAKQSSGSKADAEEEALPPPPPQKWKKTVDPLTRKPTWLCAEDKLVIACEPKPHPWRAVPISDSVKPFYWWNTDTKETEWP